MRIELPTSLMLSIAGGCIAASVAIRCWPEAEDARVWALPRDFNGRSTDLKKDLALMWEERGNGWSSDRALEAAVRAFNTVELDGKSRDQIVAILGDPARRVSFYPTTRPSTLAYRFDNGISGWQFNIPFADHRAVGMERLEIE